MSKDRIFFNKKFFPFFNMQFLTAVNDNMLKNSILVMLTFNGIKIFSFSELQTVNMAVFLFILPYFLFSSYAGKLADFYPKVSIVKIIKVAEIFIMGVAAFSFFYKLGFLMLFSLFLMGCHSAFLGPIKYSILPQYFDNSSIPMANAYVEMGTFVAVLLGQTLGSWFASGSEVWVISAGLFILSLFGLYFSYKMVTTKAVSTPYKLNKNPLLDSYSMYRKVTTNKLVWCNLHAISWFWGLGVFYTTQLPVFTKDYLNANGHVFSIILTLFSLGIGIGAIACAKFSGGKIVRKFVPMSSVAISILTLLLVFYNHLPVELFKYTHSSGQLSKNSLISVISYISNINGVINLLILFSIGFFAGFYSVTCYTDLQLNADDKFRSQVISANNILNAVYMIVFAVCVAIMSYWFSLWSIFILIIILNLLFAFWYYKKLVLCNDFIKS